VSGLAEESLLSFIKCKKSDTYIYVFKLLLPETNFDETGIGI